MVTKTAMFQFFDTIRWLSDKVGIDQMMPSKISPGPAELDFGVANITNPVVWALNAWDETISAVNFTKPGLSNATNI